MDKARAHLFHLKEMGQLEWIVKDKVCRVIHLSGRVSTWQKVPKLFRRPKSLPKHAPQNPKEKPWWELVSVDESGHNDGL